MSLGGDCHLGTACTRLPKRLSGQTQRRGRVAQWLEHSLPYRKLTSSSAVISWMDDQDVVVSAFLCCEEFVNYEPRELRSDSPIQHNGLLRTMSPVDSSVSEFLLS